VAIVDDADIRAATVVVGCTTFFDSMAANEGN